VLGGTAVALIGVVVPMTVLQRVTPLGAVLSWNPDVVSFVGSGIGAYGFYGFPGVGLLTLWVLLVLVELRTRDRI